MSDEVRNDVVEIPEIVKPSRKRPSSGVDDGKIKLAKKKRKSAISANNEGTVEVDESPKTKKPRKSAGKPNALDRQLSKISSDIMSQFGVSDDNGLIPCQAVVRPNFPGPLSIETRLRLGLGGNLTFIYKPKISCGIDVGLRRFGVDVTAQARPDSPLITLITENVNLCVKKKLQVSDLHLIYGTKPLPPGTTSWFDVYDENGVIREDRQLFSEIASSLKSITSENFSSICRKTIGGNTPANVDVADVMQFKRVNKNQLINKFILDHAFDTSEDPSYSIRREMNKENDEPIPSSREEVDQIIKTSLSVLARYIKEAFGTLTHIFIEDQSLIFGHDGKMNQSTIRSTLERYFDPDNETIYDWVSGSHKLKILSLNDDEIKRLKIAGLWTKRYFRSMGPSAKIVYYVEPLPPKYRYILERMFPKLEEEENTNGASEDGDIELEDGDGSKKTRPSISSMLKKSASSSTNGKSTSSQALITDIESSSVEEDVQGKTSVSSHFLKDHSVPLGVTSSPASPHSLQSRLVECVTIEDDDEMDKDALDDDAFRDWMSSVTSSTSDNSTVLTVVNNDTFTQNEKSSPRKQKEEEEERGDSAPRITPESHETEHQISRSTTMMMSEYLDDQVSSSVGINEKWDDVGSDHVRISTGSGDFKMTISVAKPAKKRDISQNTAKEENDGSILTVPEKKQNMKKRKRITDSTNGSDVSEPKKKKNCQQLLNGTGRQLLSSIGVDKPVAIFGESVDDRIELECDVVSDEILETPAFGPVQLENHQVQTTANPSQLHDLTNGVVVSTMSVTTSEKVLGNQQSQQITHSPKVATQTFVTGSMKQKMNGNIHDDPLLKISKPSGTAGASRFSLSAILKKFKVIEPVKCVPGMPSNNTK